LLYCHLNKQLFLTIPPNRFFLGWIVRKLIFPYSLYTGSPAPSSCMDMPVVSCFHTQLSDSVPMLESALEKEDKFSKVLLLFKFFREIHSLYCVAHISIQTDTWTKNWRRKFCKVRQFFQFLRSIYGKYIVSPKDPRETRVCIFIKDPWCEHVLTLTKTAEVRSRLFCTDLVGPDGYVSIIRSGTRGVPDHSFLAFNVQLYSFL